MKLHELFESTTTLIVYRGTKIPETTIGDSAKMKAIFATTVKDYAAQYGEEVATYKATGVNVLDYDVGDRGSTAEQIVGAHLIKTGETTQAKFDRDPRMAMALQFMIPTDSFTSAIRDAGYDAVRMHADNTKKDEVMIINPTKFRKVE